MIDNLVKLIKRATFNQFASLDDLFIEHDQRDPEQVTNRYELRVDGPYIRELQRNYFHVVVEVNVLVETIKNPEQLYLHSERKDTALALFTPCIRVFDDNNEVLFVLTRRDEFRNHLTVNDFGTVENTLPILEATIEASYEVYHRKEDS